MERYRAKRRLEAEWYDGTAEAMNRCRGLCGLPPVDLDKGSTVYLPGKAGSVEGEASFYVVRFEDGTTARMTKDALETDYEKVDGVGMYYMDGKEAGGGHVL